MTPEKPNSAVHGRQSKPAKRSERLGHGWLEDLPGLGNRDSQGQPGSKAPSEKAVSVPDIGKREIQAPSCPLSIEISVSQWRVADRGCGYNRSMVDLPKAF